MYYCIVLVHKGKVAPKKWMSYLVNSLVSEGAVIFSRSYEQFSPVEIIAFFSFCVSVFRESDRPRLKEVSGSSLPGKKYKSYFFSRGIFKFDEFPLEVMRPL